MNTKFVEIEPQTQKMILESKLKSVDTVDAMLSQIRQEYFITDKNFNDIWVVLNEAVSNAIKHGNRFDPVKKVKISFEVKNERYLCFIVSDEGNGFAPELVPDPTSPERIAEPNGRGIFIMKRLADKVTFSENGKKVEMQFDLYKN